ncbi:MAG: 50S ribosomal protein L4 [Acidobacteriota bacterium]|nr:50S ribosomal protein L4 [Acidobacteriota bacterium]
MTLDVINKENKKIDSVELSDDVFGGPVATSLIWESVVHEQASRRRGTHATKTRGLVSGTGKKPWRQKGTGRARVGEARNPLWRTGGTVFGPRPRSYAYRLPRKVALGALRAALSQKLQEGSVMVLSALAVVEPKTRKAVELLDGLGVSGKALLIDVHPDENLLRASNNLRGVQVVPSGRVTARDLIDARSVIVTKSAVEHLAKVLAR